MQNYVNLVRTLYQSGQEIISNYSQGNKGKATMVKIDKSTTVYDARCFHTTPIDSPKCIKILSNLIYLFNHGQSFTIDEANQLFFAITKLLQSEQLLLRRILYVSVKQMRNQPSIYIVTSSLLKDIHHKNHNFRRNALRTIPMVIDQSNLAQVERYIKGLIADPDVGVSSGALLSGIQMFQINEEMVRKWGNQVLQKLNSKDQYVQYQALILVGDIKRKDINSLIKLLFSLMKQNSLTGIAAVQHLRMLREIAKEIQYDSPEAKDYTNFLNRQVRNKDDNIVIEACRLACQSPFMSNKDLLDIVKILQPYLVSESTVKKYSVLKIFNSLLKNQSRKSLIVNVKQIQKVLNDTNTSLSSIAASILLRICSEAYLQTLFVRIDKTMSQMSIQYKIDVLKSLVNVLKTYPKKYQLINTFLLKVINRQTTLEIKSEAIEVMRFQIIEIGGIAKTQCIRQLSRLLAASSYDRLHFQILGIISREATKQDINSDIFKNIISEIYLKEGAVRACGLSTLMKLSEFQEHQKDALEKTIQKFTNDQDQEVRERLTFRKKDKPLTNYQLDLIENYLNYNCKEIQASDDVKALDYQTIKQWGADVGPSLLKGKISTKEGVVQKNQNEELTKYSQIFQNHPSFKEYGVLRKINRSIQITDSDSELQVQLRIFLFDHFLILEFRVQNKTPHSFLENVKIQLKHSGEAFQVKHIIPAKSIAVGESGESFVGLKKIQEKGQGESEQQNDNLFPQQKFSAIAKFTQKEMKGDIVKATYQDQFSLQDFDVKLSTYMSASYVEPAEFGKVWEEMKGYEENGTFKLSKYASTQAAEQELIRHFGMRKIENVEGNSSNKSNMVTVNLLGKYLGVQDVMMVLMLAYDTKMGCLLKIKVKSQREDLTNQLISSMQ